MAPLVYINQLECSSISVHVDGKHEDTSCPAPQLVFFLSVIIMKLKTTISLFLTAYRRTAGI